MSGPRSVIERSTRCIIVVGVAERDLFAEPRPALVVVDRALDLGVHLGELALRLQSPTLDAGDRVVADHVVRVGSRRHRGHDATSTSDVGAHADRPARKCSHDLATRAPALA